MAIQLERHLFTLEEFERMVESGGFDEHARVELIRGEIVDMAATGIHHEACVAKLTRLLDRLSGDVALVWPQNSIRLPNSDSRPEPDIVMLKWRDDYYADKRPMPEDVLVLIEVAETSIRYDREVKGPLYAQAEIPEYWIVNLQDNVIEVYTDPVEGVYKQTKEARRGETLPLPATIGGAISVTDILGNEDA